MAILTPLIISLLLFVCIQWAYRVVLERLQNLLSRMLILAVPLITWHSAAYALNIGPLLDTCPQYDTAYSQIRGDFEIRRNRVVVQDVPCSEPISQLPISMYTDELIALQGLRAVFYMDLGSNHLPWAPGTLYDWMKSKIGGIDISDTSPRSFCCEMLDGKVFIVITAQDDSNRNFDRTWNGISGNIDLYVHEARHRDGFGHVSCCGILGGCDQSYDEANLSPYGTQWWLQAHWLTGELYVGFSCLDPRQVQQIAQWHLDSANSFRNRFCDNKPPFLTMPDMPGGECRMNQPYPLINDLVSVGNITTAFEPTPRAHAPAGTFHITAEFINTSAESIFYHFAEVAEITGGDLLLNADGGAGGVGARLTPARNPGSSLLPGASEVVQFVIGLQAREPFTFFVNLRGDAR